MNKVCFSLESGRKTIRLGALPSSNLPKKSHETRKTPERRHINIVQEREATPTKELARTTYFNFVDFYSRIRELKLNDWKLEFNDSQVTFKKFTTPYITPNFEVIVDESLEFTCLIFGWLLPDEHEIYKEYRRSVRNHTITELFQQLLTYNLCMR